MIILRAYHNQKNWRVEELVAKEIQVLAIQSLYDSTDDNQCQSRDLKEKLAWVIMFDEIVAGKSL